MDRLYTGPIYFPNAQSRFVVIDNVKIHYVVEGRGQDIVLIHGLAANIYCWRKLIPILARKFRVWAIDLKGFGLSDKPRGSSYDLQTQALLVSHFIEHMNLETCH